MVPGSSLFTRVAEALLDGGEYGGVDLPAVVRAAQLTLATKPATVNACRIFDMMCPFYTPANGATFIATAASSHSIGESPHSLSQR
jgi:hypothetical protein